MLKKILVVILFVPVLISAQALKFGEAKGLFMSVGVGPRIPIGDFSDSHNLGSGFGVTFSYTDNAILPVFFYAEIGYQHYPGKQDFYKETDYSSISSNMVLLNTGVRYYYSPLVENIVLLMPVIEAGLSVGYIETSHQFQLDKNRQNFLEDVGKVGFHVGAGFSMFLLDVIGYYNYFQNNQYISFDLKVRIPIFVTY